MKKKKDYTIECLLFCLLLAIMGSMVSCQRIGYGCNGRSKIMTRVNAVNMRDYQVELTNDSIIIYDGKRKVNSVKWEDNPTALDSVFLKDNL